MLDPHPIVDRILADPPLVHDTTAADGTDILGVYGTSRSAYDLIANTCDAQSVTLETGLGISTAVFAAVGTSHTCVVPNEAEGDRLNRYLSDRGIDCSRLRIISELSENFLPKLDGINLDFVFIDGSHGFPFPMVDWFYTCRWLRKGGIVVLDDVQLPAVDMLTLFLDRDPRWERVHLDRACAAYRRLTDDSLSEDWWPQRTFYTGPDRRYIAKKAEAKILRSLHKTVRLARFIGVGIARRNR